MKYIFANWKMYLDFDESCVLANQLISESFDSKKVNLGVFPNMLAVPEVKKIIHDSDIQLGAQNCSWVPKGAYTGATSALMLEKIDCKYVLVGHSERRHIFGESNEDVRKKIEACLDSGLTPVLCIGETLEDRESDRLEYRLKKQIMKAFGNLDGVERAMVAYEPVWAISGSGSGLLCNPEDADEVHNWVRKELKQHTDTEIPLLFGGSVNAESVVSYVSLDSVDGVLVGGASRKLDTFLPLVRAVEQAL